MTTHDTAPRSNPVGIAALIAGIVLVLAGILNQAVTPAIPRMFEEWGLSYSVIPLMFSLPQMVIALIATVLGVIGLLLRGRARTAALIGTTLGASHLLSTVIGAIASTAVTAILL